jgi:hypothetical protein
LGYKDLSEFDGVNTEGLPVGYKGVKTKNDTNKIIEKFLKIK